jgi:cytochrome c-type biogenesis protein
LIPGFLAYLAGTTVAGAQVKRKDMFVHSLLFVIGFSLVFSLLGVLLNTVLESVAYDAQEWLSRIGGVIIIFFGLYLTGLIHVGFLEKTLKIRVSEKSGRSRYVTSVLFGAAFAAGWTPCVGIALGAILGLAASQPGTAFYLLLAYSIGLGIPFLIAGVFAAELQRVLQRLGTFAHYLNIVFGGILIVLGVLIFTQNLAQVANWEILNQLLLRM